MHFGQYGRHYEDGYHRKNEYRFEKRHQNREPAVADTQQPFVVLHERFQQVGYEPCHQKGQQNRAENVDQPYNRSDDGDCDQHPHYAVEGIRTAQTASGVTYVGVIVHRLFDYHLQR